MYVAAVAFSRVFFQLPLPSVAIYFANLFCLFIFITKDNFLKYLPQVTHIFSALSFTFTYVYLYVYLLLCLVKNHKFCLM